MHHINSVTAILDYTPKYFSYFQLPHLISENNLLISSLFMFVYNHKMQERNSLIYHN